MERAQHSPVKDDRKAEQVARAFARLKKHTETGYQSSECINLLKEYKIMAEEFRVSIFAPELGTVMPVSEKRLQKKWEEVENACYRVE